MNQMTYREKSQQHYDYMLIALIPLIICACFIYSLRVLLVCGTAFVTSRMVDVGVSVIRKQPIDTEDKSSAVAALTYCMMLPVSIPLYIVAVTVALVTLVGKHVFGGKDVYPFNLAALAMCVSAVNWPEEVFKAVTPLTAVSFWSGAAQSTLSGSSQIKLGGLPYISTFDLLLGDHPGAMGSSFLLVILAVAVFLLVTKRITWHIPVSFITTCGLFALAFPRIYGVSVLYSLKYELLCSSVLFYAVFMLNEPATTPRNPKAKIVFGVITALLAMMFRYFGSYEIGGCFALLLVNATEGFWDRLFEEGSVFSERKSGVVSMPKTLIADVKKAEKEHKKAASAKKNTYSVKKAETKVEKTAKISTDEKHSKVYKKDGGEKAKQPVKPASNKPKTHSPISDKPKVNKKPVADKDMGETKTLDIISRAEDHIDQIEFSTQTIDMEQALREFEEKYSKGGK